MEVAGPEEMASFCLDAEMSLICIAPKDDMPSQGTLEGEVKTPGDRQEEKALLLTGRDLQHKNTREVVSIHGLSWAGRQQNDGQYDSHPKKKKPPEVKKNVSEDMNIIGETWPNSL